MKTTIHITVIGGVVCAVAPIPPGVEVLVVDYDIEGANPDRITASPLDGEACTITKYDERGNKPG